MSGNLFVQNSQSLQARGLVSKKANYLNWNSPTASTFVEAWVTNLVGDHDSEVGAPWAEKTLQPLHNPSA
jgi:hypothetical protein